MRELLPTTLNQNKLFFKVEKIFGLKGGACKVIPLDDPPPCSQLGEEDGLLDKHEGLMYNFNYLNAFNFPNIILQVEVHKFPIKECICCRASLSHSCNSHTTGCPTKLDSLWSSLIFEIISKFRKTNFRDTIIEIHTTKCP